MKRFVFGVMVFLTGVFFAAVNYIYAMMNPWDFNGVGGLLGSFLGTNTLAPFLISVAITLLGAGLCIHEAYFRK